MDLGKCHFLAITLLEIANFDLPFLTPGWLENGVCMGNRSGYKAILKKSPYF